MLLLEVRGLSPCTCLQAPSLQYQIYPRIDRLDCRTDDIGGGAGPPAQAQRRRLLFGGDTPASNAAKLGLVRILHVCSVHLHQAAAPCKGSNKPAACVCPKDAAVVPNKPELVARK